MVAKKNTKQVVVILTEPQPKKHVVRFDSEEEGAAIGNVYVSKEALKLLGDPDSIKVTIEAA